MTLDDALKDGSLGYSWTVPDETADLDTAPDRGYVHTDGGWLKLELLDEEDELTSFRTWASGKPRKSPEALVGMLPEDAAVFLEVRGPWHTQRFGPRASSKTLLARTAIGGVPLDRLRTVRLTELQADFPGIDYWAGLSASTEKWTESESGRLESWSVTLTGSERLESSLRSTRTLHVSTTWRVEGPMPRRLVSIPVTIGCESRRPLPLRSLLEPVLDAQDLISCAFDSFVPAESGSGRLDVDPTDKPNLEARRSIWNGALMVRSPAVPDPGERRDLPIFSLATIGGVRGLARWTQLASAHPRATRAVVARYRQGLRSPQLALMEVAAAIEYWVARHARVTWARGSTRGWPIVDVLAKQCGTAFAGWVGDRESWSKAVWDAYIPLKHLTGSERDPWDLADLAESARYMLGGALLNRVAGRKSPSQAMFRNHRLDGLGSRIREKYA
jgi:hypothetical protein